MAGGNPGITKIDDEHGQIHCRRPERGDQQMPGIYAKLNTTSTIMERPG